MEDNNDTRIIKKYPNRRLYDTEKSTYITLPQVRELILEGTPFKVIDTQSKADITRSILLQIIIEQESDTNPLFSNENLARFIKYYGDNSQQGFNQFMDNSLQFFHEQQEVIQSSMKDLMQTNPVDFWTDVGEKNVEMWQNMQNDFLSSMGFPNKKKK